MQRKSRLASKLEDLFGIDLRSLALFRIGLGMVILVDLLTRAVDLRAFYTDLGILPRAALLEHPTYFWPVSVYMFDGSVLFAALLFLLTGLFALALLLGYRTWLATFACWLLMTSLHARNPFVNQAGDTLLHLYLFWAMFLPLGSRWSLDRDDPHAPSDRIFSGGSVALLLQVCLVYWFAAINKTGAYWREGTALYFVLNLNAVAGSTGMLLLGFPRLLKFLSRFTLWFEGLGPFLAFLPLKTDFFRTLTVFLFLGFHLGMIIFLKLGSFPYISMLGWLVFLPSGFWERLPKRSPAPESPRPKKPHIKTKLQWAADILALTTILYILLVNFAFTSIEKFRPVFIQKYRWVGKLLSIDQSWAMFAPNPLLDNWWYEIPGKLRDGSEIELYGLGIFAREERPPNIPSGILNVKWRKYLSWVANKNFASLLPYYGQYLCREWNSQALGGKELDSLRIFYIHQTILPNFQKLAPQKSLLWEQSCSAVKPLK